MTTSKLAVTLTVALASALAACAVDAEPSGGRSLPGPSLAKSLCPTGCAPGLEEAIGGSTWTERGDGLYERIEILDPTTDPAAPGAGSDLHGELDLELFADPCAALIHTGSCADACHPTPTTTQPAGGACVVVQCPGEVVLARCDL